jgi:hypothetical protein
MAPVIKGKKPGPGFLKFPRESFTEPRQIKTPKKTHTTLPQLSRFIFFSKAEDQEV